MGMRTMLRCSLIAGVVAATVVLSACAPEMPPTMMPSPVETPRTATPEAAWPVRDTYHSFANANSNVVVVLSQGGPLPGLVQEVEVLKELSPLNLERLHLVNVHQAQTIDPTFPISSLQGLPQSAMELPDVAE